MLKKLLVIILINAIPFFAFLTSNLSIDCYLSSKEVVNIEVDQESRAIAGVECDIESNDVQLYFENQ